MATIEIISPDCILVCFPGNAYMLTGTKAELLSLTLPLVDAGKLSSGEWSKLL